MAECGATGASQEPGRCKHQSSSEPPAVALPVSDRSGHETTRSRCPLVLRQLRRRGRRAGARFGLLGAFADRSRMRRAHRALTASPTWS
jgi:hypothetical protein